MSSDRLGLSDLRFYAHHGAAEHERVVGQWFSADIEMALDLGPPARSDDLGATVDYRDVASVALEAATGERAALLERVAERIALRLLAAFPATEARVRLRKFSPPGPASPRRHGSRSFGTAAPRREPPRRAVPAPGRREPHACGGEGPQAAGRPCSW